MWKQAKYEYDKNRRDKAKNNNLCIHCIINKPFGGRVKCIDCIRKESKYGKKTYKQTREKKIQQVKNNYIKNKDKISHRMSKYNKNRRHLLRDELFNILGRECINCNYNDERALVFDHIKDDGNAERKLFKNINSIYNYYVINSELAKQKLQVLCWNCNWIKLQTLRGELP